MAMEAEQRPDISGLPADDGARFRILIGELAFDCARINSAATFLSSPMLVAEIGQAARGAILESDSPWVDREGAARRWHCSEREIDRAAQAGILTRYPRGGSPLFLKAEGDEAIRGGKWKAGTAATAKKQSNKTTR